MVEIKIGLIDVDGINIKPVKGYEDRYVISRSGDIWSIKRSLFSHGKILETNKPYKLKPSKDKYGYLVVNLYNGNGCKSKKVHNLVASTFIENPYNKKCACHKDNNKENCNADNLYWGTDEENNLQARKDGLFKNETKVCQYDLNDNFINEYKSIAEAIRKSGAKNIWKCIHGERKTAGGYKWKKSV